MIHLEWLLALGYIDSLFAERTAVTGRPLGTLPETLSQLYLQAMRHHAREAVLLSRDGEQWAPVPDWRFDRQVIRIALYLKERAGLKPGDRVAVVSELRQEWLAAEWAAVGLGAVSVAVDPNLPPARLTGALVEAGARVIFASETALSKLDDGTMSLPGLTEVVAFTTHRPADSVRTIAEIVELGGTLDTAERAQAFRAHARNIPADQPALSQHDASVQGRVAWHEVTQGQAVERIGQWWKLRPAQEGDRTYVVAGSPSLRLRLALHACVADGYTLTVLGGTGRAQAELAEIGPHRIIAPPPMLEDALHGAVERPPEPKKPQGWRERASRAFGRGSHTSAQQPLRTALGGRVRAIDPLGPLDPRLAEKLRRVASVGTEEII
jgi:AMP-binding enzyme